MRTEKQKKVWKQWYKEHKEHRKKYYEYSKNLKNNPDIIKLKEKFCPLCKNKFKQQNPLQIYCGSKKNKIINCKYLKKCKHCKKIKENKHFKQKLEKRTNPPFFYFDNYCLDCVNIVAKKYYHYSVEKSKEYYGKRKNNPEFKRKNRERVKKWVNENREMYLKNVKKRLLEKKILVFKEYGKQQGGIMCACCGEKMIEFLCIDHINGGGSKHRKALKKAGWEFYRWLVKNNFPKGYQLLCHNCNQGKHIYGECPHKRQ